MAKWASFLFLGARNASELLRRFEELKLIAKPLNLL